MQLIEPAAEFIASYLSALEEFDQLGIRGFWKSFAPVDDPVVYVERIKCYQHWTGMENNVVPANVYWLVDGNEFIGHVSVRHAVDASPKRGGHIGYAIRPSKHRRGYGSNLLRLVLPHVRALGIQSALVTCDKSNIASRKIIEKNGGVFFDEIEIDGTPVLQFWIPL